MELAQMRARQAEQDAAIEAAKPKPESTQNLAIVRQMMAKRRPA
tara:strand:- start:9725 stop:9856 length:132 start_codon:yes stop_codon:yes gene_type:complete